MSAAAVTPTAATTLGPAQSATDRRRASSASAGPTALELAPWLARHPRKYPGPGRVYRRVKRFLDVGIVAATAPVWATAYAACALAVKLDSPDGPVHFAQERTGTAGERFRLYKLRTMVPDAEERKDSLAHLNERAWPDFKISDDPRITVVGRVLRASSLDELPQLFNVLRGDLSLVGPRPWSKGLEDHEDWHIERYGVSAGLTGLWQIAARDAESFTERIRLDVAYAQRRSLLLDLELLLRTVPAVLRRQGA